MCGFVGFWGFGTQVSSIAHKISKRMAQKLTHRGPNDEGVWFDKTIELTFVHRRLSVIDLSPAGHQPMLSSTGRYVIAFNGEIYNHLKLREKLEKYTNKTIKWKGHSDTETLLEAIESWGVKKALQQSNGMFAFALWDRKKRVLCLARDRMGEKPLYYGWQGQGDNAVFLFGSELKALKIHPSFNDNVNTGALSFFLRHSYIPAPYSIYTDIAKLKAGHLLILDEKHFRQRTLPESLVYWSLVDVVLAGVADPWQGDDEAAIMHLDVLLRTILEEQMIADVPLGAFLSGGVDSSTVVALMQTQSTRPIKTFSIGFHEAGYNEAVHAKAVAKHLGTDHADLYVSSQEAQAVIPKLATIYDEPFSDPSQIPTFLLSKLAKEKVTVSLSGDAGDELFCGYNRYLIAKRWNNMHLVPVALRRRLANLISSFSPHQWDRLAMWLPGSALHANFGDKLHKVASVLESQTIDELYQGLNTHWLEPEKNILNGYETPNPFSNSMPNLTGLDGVQQMMVQDALTYLPDDILTKLDRAAMAVSLESRVPYLDHRNVEFAWRLPQSLKLRRGQSKWILRQVLNKYVPKELVERPKMGFNVPINTWLRGSLRDWSESLLSESRLKQEGFFNSDPIRRKWAEHLEGKRNWHAHLWDVLMFQAWLENERAA